MAAAQTRTRVGFNDYMRIGEPDALSESVGSLVN